MLFCGEEQGLVGIENFLRTDEALDIVLPLERCISLDRKGYTDIVTAMMGTPACSTEFAACLSTMLIEQGLPYFPDPTGSYTDSFYLMSLVPEVANLSVGYFKNHSKDEIQDLAFLDRLGVALSKIDWESLPIEEKEDKKTAYWGLNDPVSKNDNERWDSWWQDIDWQKDQ